MFGEKGRKTPLQREPLANLEDVRDDCIALYLNSGLSAQQLHARGGPTPQTIMRWLYKETVFPRLDTVRAILRALGRDFAIAPVEVVKTARKEVPIEARLGLSISIDKRPKMPPRKKASSIRANARKKHRVES